MSELRAPPPRMTPSPVPSSASSTHTQGSVGRSRVLAAAAAFERGGATSVAKGVVDKERERLDRQREMAKLEEGKRVSMNREEIKRLGEEANTERLSRLSSVDVTFSYTSPLSPSRRSSILSAFSSPSHPSTPEQSTTSPLNSRSSTSHGLTSEPEEILATPSMSPSSTSSPPPRSPLRSVSNGGGPGAISPANGVTNGSGSTSDGRAMGHSRSETSDTIISPVVTPTSLPASSSSNSISTSDIGNPATSSAAYKQKRKSSVSSFTFPSPSGIGSTAGGEKTPTLQPSTPIATTHALQTPSSHSTAPFDTSSIPIPPIPRDPQSLMVGSAGVRTPKTSTSSITVARPAKSPKRSLTNKPNAALHALQTAGSTPSTSTPSGSEKKEHDFTPGDEKEWMERVGGLLGLNGLQIPSGGGERKSALLARTGSLARNPKTSLSSSTSMSTGTSGMGEGHRRDSSSDDLKMLAISAAMTELSMSMQEIQILIFEIQEMRHATSNKEELDYADITSISPTLNPTPHRTGGQRRPPNRPSTGPEETNSDISALPGGSMPPSPLKLPGTASVPMASSMSSGSGSLKVDGMETAIGGSVDDALMRLDARLDAVALEFRVLEERIGPLLTSEGGGEEREFVKKKRAALLREWEGAQRDAENLTEELREDRWLTVFRTVGQQAEEMMGSLEKVVEQCKGVRVKKGMKNVFLERGAEWKKEVEGFVSLNKSFKLKRKFYTPSCDRVLKILEKGINERSTRNGEVLRRFADMKARWKALGERMERIERDMTELEKMAVEVCRVKGEIVEGVEVMMEKEKEKEKERPLKEKTSSLLSPPATPFSKTGGALSRTVSPFRKLANKITSSTRSRTPPNSSPSLPPTMRTASPSVFRSMSRQSKMSDTVKMRPSLPNSSPLASPPRPAVNPGTMRKMPSSGDLIGMRRRPPSSAATHKHSNSVTGAGNPLISRPRSPVGAYVPPSLEGKPRWNISTKADPKADNYDTLTPNKSSRLGMPSTFSRSRTASPAFNGRASSRAGAATPTLAPPSTPGKRAPSPSFSTVSVGGTPLKARPQSPSLIPAPAKHSPTKSLIRSTTPFSSLEDDEPTSMLQRAMSPSPSQFSASVITTSTHYRPSSRLSNATGSKIPQLSFSPPSQSGLARAQTPEVSMLARAQRIAAYQTPANRTFNGSDYESIPPKTPPVSSRKQLAKAMSTSSVASSSFSGYTSKTSPPTSKRSSPPLYPSPSLTAPPYEPNRYDPLDVEIAKIVNSQTLRIKVERMDPKLNKNIEVNLSGGLMARYKFGEPGAMPGVDTSKPVMVKVVERGKGGLRKVMVRIGGGWMDLELYLLSRQAAFA